MCVFLRLLKVINYIVMLYFKGLNPSVTFNGTTLPPSISTSRDLFLTPEEHAHHQSNAPVKTI